MKLPKILPLLQALLLISSFSAYAQDVSRGTEPEIIRIVDDALARIKEVGIEKCLC